MPDGEPSKSARVLEQLYTWLLENKIERQGTVIALGGGVIGDLAGYTAATYLRGINLIHIPTTLLAQVDSSIVKSDNNIVVFIILLFYHYP